MLEKIKNLFSLDYLNEDEPVQHSGSPTASH